MSSKWYVAPALEELRLQLNEAFPRRSKISDGGIGDEAHASRSSDHNPWVKDAKGVGVVTARDFTHDPAGGLDCRWLADELVKHKDPRIKYVIWDHQMVSSYPAYGYKAWAWRPYHGVNAHAHHLHLSVNPESRSWSDKKPWTLDRPSKAHDDVARVVDVPETQSSAAAPIEGRPDTSTENTGSGDIPTVGQSESHSTGQPPTVVTSATASSDGTSTVGVTAAGTVDPTASDSFKAYIPQIDSAKSWLRRMLAGSTLGALLAYVGGLPLWMQIGMFSLVGFIVIGIIVIFIRYHREIFAYVTQMNVLRATPNVGSPLVSGRPPSDRVDQRLG